MTSQVAIFSPLGVAVASDTVTTISSNRGTKTSNNAMKVWPLGDRHLVVVAHSGAVASNGIHTQLLVKEWARTLEHPLPSIADYAMSFSAWFAHEAEMVPTESEIREVHLHINDHFYEIKRRILVDAEDVDDPDEIANILKFHINAGYEWLASLDNFPGSTDEDDAELLALLQINIDETINHFFEGLPLSQEGREVLKKSAPLILSRVQPSEADSELGFIGFGSTDYFASCIRMKLRGRYGKVPRSVSDERFGASATSQSGSIAFFAQSQAMSGFLRGAQYDVLESAYGYIWEQLTKGDELGEDRLDEVNSFMSGLREHVEEIQDRYLISPMLDTIGTLSLMDMANLATSLVGMQAIRSAASPEPASVGGFIESLVIDRAEGIRWINQLPR